MNDTEFRDHMYQQIHKIYIVSIFNAVIFSLCFVFLWVLTSVLGEDPDQIEADRIRTRQDIERRVREEYHDRSRQRRCQSIQDPPPPYSSVENVQG